MLTGILSVHRSGAVGINLTQANRVFIMEPAMNPALEAQAIGRIYRLGQRKPVTVIKYVCQNSFESRLIKILKKKYGNISKPSPWIMDKVSQNPSLDKHPTCTENTISGIGLGHMKNDRAEMMTEEFDAMFGITEPEDLPDHTNFVQQINSSSSKQENDDDSESFGDGFPEEKPEEDAYSNANDYSSCNDYDSDESSEHCVIS